jgi:hypothetical protein
MVRQLFRFIIPVGVFKVSLNSDDILTRVQGHPSHPHRIPRMEVPQRNEVCGSGRHPYQSGAG